MDVNAIKTTEEFLSKNKKNTAVIYLNSGQTYETNAIYKVLEPQVSSFQPLIVIDVNLEEEDLAIIPIANIHHIIIKGPEKEKKVGFFVKKSK